jgi:carboxyl-terminal processing protease
LNTRTLYTLLIAIVATVSLVSLTQDPRYHALASLVTATQIISDQALLATDPEQLKVGAIEGMVSVLDNYSTWHNARSDTLVRRTARGHYGGFGVEIVNFGDTTMIWQVFPNSPAEEAGLQLGDRLLFADTVNLQALTLDSVHTVLRMLPKDEVPIKIYRPADQSVHDYICARAEIDVSTVTVWGRIDDIGYVSIGAFNRRTAAALKRALDTLTENGVEKFIVDLRGNPGGLLNAAADCAELFLPQAGLIVSVSGVYPSDEIDGEVGAYPTEPLVILVDEGSASGSELMAGCLQDWDRSVLVGSPTYGKGFVQNIYPLRDQSSLRLTIGQYHTPTGRTFYRPDTSISPDTILYKSKVYGRTIVGAGQIFPDLGSSVRDCPSHLAQTLFGEGPFNFTAELLGQNPLPRLDESLTDAYWNSRHCPYSTRIVTQLKALAPADLVSDLAWNALLTDAEQNEARFDRENSSNCFLYVVSRHLVRAGKRLRLLEEPVLSTDPALVEAMRILRDTDAYYNIIRGQSTPPPPIEP